MGEIADALRRAKLERQRSPGSRPERAETGTSPGFGPATPERSGVGDAVRAAVQDSLRDAPWGEVAARVSLVEDKQGERAARIVLEEDASPAAQCYRSFALKLGRALPGAGRTILVTSALPREGKTTSACNLALALALFSHQRRTALVDLDLRKPSVARSLAVRVRSGVDEVLAGDAGLGETCLRTDIDGLDLYPTARSNRNAQALLATPALPAMIEELSSYYDAIVIDGPPAVVVPDVAMIAEHVTGCVAVVRAGQTRQAAFRELQSILPPGQLLGVLLNMANLPHHARQYGYYDYREPDSGEAGEQ